MEMIHTILYILFSILGIYLLYEIGTSLVILVITGLILVGIFIYFLYKKRKINVIQFFNNKLSSKGVKGVCYFDIDGTLTTARGNSDEIIQECLDKNFDVGIITASSRTLADVCDKNGKSRHKWMSPKLCSILTENGGKTFNSAVSLAGKPLPDNYPHNASYGYKKGYAMEYGRKNFYPNIPEKHVVLFDDDTAVLSDVKYYNPNLETQCSNMSCKTSENGGGFLTKELVREKLKNLS